ncbi:putative prophage protein [Sphaerospermopsis reniformis]|uniref:Putative prophage protein n=1 Tax=Sphaerospermopsis reniformis TaxID=531300 RepID=A0A480A976_9CYAN|nr:type II toxin-antitoxin system antitoxin SocA domain-containing protein [Sphaerospermopsis reniformis]GCL39808.1 putative prophage protein [Sphaerospermopsis reniformis]
MIDCLTVARYFIIKAYQDGIEAEMTNMKVQKLLYYAQSLYLAMYDQQLFPEEIQAWRYGPVCPPAYRFYSEFEAKQLPIPSQESLSEISEDYKQLLEEVWEYFGGYHAYRLSDKLLCS